MLSREALSVNERLICYAPKSVFCYIWNFNMILNMTKALIYLIILSLFLLVSNDPGIMLLNFFIVIFLSPIL